MKKILGFGLLLSAVLAFSAFGSGRHDNSLVKFDGGIGVDPVSNVVVSGTTTTVSANVVVAFLPRDKFGGSPISMPT